MTPAADLGSVSDLALPAPDAVVRYATHDDGLLDVHLPPDPLPDPLPGSLPGRRLVLLLHGGFWRQSYDRRHTRAVAAALAGEGFVVATPEYRRVGGAGSAGSWPATGEDVEAALAAAPGLLDGVGVATTTTTVVGHSAGGHLALWLANQGHPITRVVAVAPVGDLRAAARDRLGDGAAQALLGGEPDEVPERYADADPRVRFQARPACEVRVVHGAEDDIVPVANSRGLAEAHRWVDLRVVEHADHFDVMNPTAPAWAAVLAAIR